jgi:hypothetical protein
MSAGAGDPKCCRYSKCGKPLPPPVIGYNIQERFYCSTLCRSRAQKERNPRPSRAQTPVRHVCEYAPCSKAFTAHSTRRFCSRHCNYLERERISRGSLDPARKIAALAAAKRRARCERCPDCSAPIGADEALLYCTQRCGWDLLLTAKVRDPRADTPDPTNEDDEDAMAKEPSTKPEITDEIEEEEEEEEEEPEDDEEIEEEEDEEPEDEEEDVLDEQPRRRAKKPAKAKTRRPQGETRRLLLEAVASGPKTVKELSAVLSLSLGSTSAAACEAVKQGYLAKVGHGVYGPGPNAPAPQPKVQVTRKATPAAPPAAPTAPAPTAAPVPPPAPVAPKPTVAVLQAAIAALPIDDQAALLAGLEPLAAAHRTLREARAKLAAGA